MASKRISVEELRTQSQIDLLIGRLHRGQDLLSVINEYDDPFKDLIRAIDKALNRPCAHERDVGSEYPGR